MFVNRLFAGALVIVALAACGQTPTADSSSSGPEPTPISTPVLEPDVLLRLAVGNMVDAPSKRLSGTATAAGSTQEFEIVYVGDEARGHKVERLGEFESVTDFVKTGGSLYILAGEAYWQWYVNLEDRFLVVDHWVRVDADHPEHSKLLVLTDSTTPWEPVGELTQEDGADPSVVVLVDTAGNRFTVSIDGTPYLVRVQLTDQTEAGPATADITLSDFGEVSETFDVPPGEIVELL
jgi:hypothetical protein